MTKTILVILLLAGSLSARAALDPAQVNQLAAEDSSDKVAAIRQLTQTADPDAVRVLKAMAEDGLFLAGDKAVIIDGDQAFDAATGTKMRMPANPESVTVNTGFAANWLARWRHSSCSMPSAPFGSHQPGNCRARSLPTWRRCWRGHWKRKAMAKSRRC